RDALVEQQPRKQLLRTRRATRLPGRPAAPNRLEAFWRLAAERRRPQEKLGQRSYPAGPSYQEWLPSRSVPAASGSRLCLVGAVRPVRQPAHWASWARERVCGAGRLQL